MALDHDHPRPSESSGAPPPYSASHHHARHHDYYAHAEPAPHYDAVLAKPTVGKYPKILNGYFSKGCNSNIYLGGREKERMYLMTQNGTFSGKPEFVLHDGPKETDPVLATSERDSIIKPKSHQLTIPAEDGVPHKEKSQRIEMKSSSLFMRHNSYTFETDVGLGKETRRERFEWRQTLGGEVEELEGYNWGWKLVRISNDSNGASSSSGAEEVVAAWTFDSSLSVTHSFRIQFLGHALTGLMGDRWATLTIMSALKIWAVSIHSSAVVVSK
ncbi:hypothetical protein GGR57DRAFT_308611 [Xylariaceae sp. FL1272]|nr:hypothetical protein GGR57DRAFT_308611 [Xylariaceae sp. FL1272]